MNETDQLAALSHPKRLALFRLLVRHHPWAVRAGVLAQTIGERANTTSAYLSSLKTAGLVSHDRVGKNIVYKADLKAAQDLVQFLFSDCCQARMPLSISANAPLMAALDTGQRRKLKCLFVCSDNASRSICAEALLRDMAQDFFVGFSAGTAPKPEPSGMALDLLVDRGHSIDQISSKSVNGFCGASAPKMDCVITLCDTAAQEQRIIWPGQPIICHWRLPRPDNTSGRFMERRQAMENTYNTLKKMIKSLITEDLQTYTRNDLQSLLNRIGLQQQGNFS